MKIKADDSKQNSIAYSSESEDSEHGLAGGVIQYIYYIFSILVSSLHAVEAYIQHIRAEFYSILFHYFIFFYCNLLFRAMHLSRVIITVAFIPPFKGIKFCFALKNGSSTQICRPSWILGSEMCFNTKLTSEMDSLWSN